MKGEYLNPKFVSPQYFVWVTVAILEELLAAELETEELELLVLELELELEIDSLEELELTELDELLLDSVFHNCCDL